MADLTPKPPRTISLDPWKILPSLPNGDYLWWVVPGYTHIICGKN